jgi:regulator of sigma E protease
MDLLQTIVSLLVTLGILVTIHEFGHFWVARKCGVKVIRFSVGFGKSLYSRFDKQGTEYSIGAIPLGGYVKMLDEREGEVSPDQLPFAFNRQPVSRRIAIAAAGPLANFLFAIFAYWMMFLSGFNVVVPIVGSVSEHSLASQAGLTRGDEIVAIDGNNTHGWRAVSMQLLKRIGDTGDISIVAKASENKPPEQFLVPVQRWLSGVSAAEIDPLAALGITPFRPVIPAVIAQVVKGSPAESGGLKPGDKVLAMGDNKTGQTKIDSWQELVKKVRASPEKPLQVLVSRHGAEVELQITPAFKTMDNGDIVGHIGVGAAPVSLPAKMIRTERYGPIAALSEALIQSWSDTVMTLSGIKKMAVGLISVDNLSGPITIARIASASISSGMEDFLRFLALLSISLGVLNLLPIPVLDGGHLLYYSAEAILGRPLPEKWQMVGMKIGISMLLLLMTVAFYNDIMRL